MPPPQQQVVHMCNVPVQGVIINGCIRDSEDIAKMPLGVKALGTYPLKSSKRDPGLSDVPVTIAGVTVHPGDWVYADKGGTIAQILSLFWRETASSIRFLSGNGMFHWWGSCV
jgi:RraA family protein